MNLCQYLKEYNDIILNDPLQAIWYDKLKCQVREGIKVLDGLASFEKRTILDEFLNRVRTEEVKAWYSAPDGDTLFQGTSVSSLTIPCKLSSPLNFDNISCLESAIADHYISLHNEHKLKVKNAIIENVDSWIKEGLYYGVVIASKVISQAFNLTVPQDRVIIKIDKYMVDPHEITKYPEEIREKYFEKVTKELECFGELQLSREELESSLILADVSKPRIKEYKSRIILAPVSCNEIAAFLALRVKRLIKEKTNGDIKPRSLSITIYDTDTPYTYHHLISCNGQQFSPILPGLIVLGASGTIDAFRWLYSYRLSLIAQKIQKGSLYSEVHKIFIPFVYFGVLVPRDAEILLDMDKLDKLRYRGNISPQIEYFYLLPSLYKYSLRRKEFDLEGYLNKITK